MMRNDAVMPDEAIARKAILAKLADSREEVRQLLDPPRVEPSGDGAPQHAGGEFPRSRTMRALLSSRGLGAAGALVGGLLIARPTLALRMLRMVPVGTVGKMLIAKAISGIAKRSSH
jgi:hypothetical protein